MRKTKAKNTPIFPPKEKISLLPNTIELSLTKIKTKPTKKKKKTTNTVKSFHSASKQNLALYKNH